MTHGNGELGDATNRPGHDLAEFEEALSALVRRSPELVPVIHAACRLLIRTVERAGRVAVGDTAESEDHVGDHDLVPPVVTDATTTPGPGPEIVSGPTERASAADVLETKEFQELFGRFSGPSVAPRTDPPRAPTGVKAKPADPDAELASLRRHVALQQAAIEYWKAKADRGFESMRDTFQRLRDRGEEEHCFMWALDQRTDSLPKARVEEIGEWYAALSDAVDLYLDEDGPGRRSARAFEHLAMVLQSTRESIGVLAQLHLRDDGLTALRHWVGRNRHRFHGGNEKGRDLLSAAYDDVEAARASLQRLESDSKAGAERDRDQAAAPRRNARIRYDRADSDIGYVGRSLRIGGETIGSSVRFGEGVGLAVSYAADFSDTRFVPRNRLLVMSSGTAAMTLHGYLPFRFVVGGSGGNLDFCYGYFDITVSRSGTGTGAGGTTASSFSMRINGWAYESVANTTIVVTPLAVPGGAGLAALAFGAAGLRGRRRGRN